MKSLIVIPNYYDVGEGGRYYELPLGLAYINGAFRETELEVECLNLNHVVGIPVYEYLRQFIIEHNIDIVLSGAITPFYPQLKKIFDTAKSVSSHIVTIAGGGAVTSEPIAFCELVDVDYGVVGEGEITDIALVRNIIAKGNPAEISGIVYKTEEGYIQTQEREAITDLDSIAFPCYDGFDIELYLDRQRVSDTYYSYYTDAPRIMPMTLARSCPYQCKFCFHPVGNKYRSRSLDNFFTELDLLVDKYEVNGILILDELFSANVEKVYTFCSRIKDYNLHWLVQMRVDIIDETLLQTMRDAGCYTISYGLESYSPTVLKNMRKHIEIQEINKALKLTYEIGIDIQGNFIFGDEMETLDTFCETLRWWCQHPYYMINLGMIETYPGTGYYKECLKNGKIADKKKFISQGSYVIDLTQSEKSHFQLFLIICKLLSYYEREGAYGTILGVEEVNGKVIFTARCAHCGETSVYKNMDAMIFRRIYFSMGCRACNHRNNFFTIDESEIPNFKRLNYLCRQLYEAKTDEDFKEAVEILYMVYMNIRDNEHPFPI